MKLTFSEILSNLRRERGLSQRQAAADLGVSQALLSHYENDAREPKLDFVIKACDYYDVPADYLLGRNRERRSGPSQLARAMSIILDELEAINKAESNLIAKYKSMASSSARSSRKNRVERKPKNPKK